VVVLVQREPSDAVDVVRGVVDVFDSPERVPVAVEPNLRAVVEEVDEVVVERPGRIECGAAADQAYVFGRLGDPDLRRLDGYGLSRTNRLTVISLPVKNLVSGG
jgi:hypothetical protein